MNYELWYMLSSIEKKNEAVLGYNLLLDDSY